MLSASRFGQLPSEASQQVAAAGAARAGIGGHAVVVPQVVEVVNDDDDDADANNRRVSKSSSDKSKSGSSVGGGGSQRRAGPANSKGSGTIDNGGGPKTTVWQFDEQIERRESGAGRYKRVCRVTGCTRFAQANASHNFEGCRDMCARHATEWRAEHRGNKGVYRNGKASKASICNTPPVTAASLAASSTAGPAAVATANAGKALKRALDNPEEPSPKRTLSQNPASAPSDATSAVDVVGSNGIGVADVDCADSDNNDVIKDENASSAAGDGGGADADADADGTGVADDRLSKVSAAAAAVDAVNPKATAIATASTEPAAIAMASMAEEDADERASSQSSKRARTATFQKTLQQLPLLAAAIEGAAEVAEITPAADPAAAEMVLPPVSAAAAAPMAGTAAAAAHPAAAAVAPMAGMVVPTATGPASAAVAPSPAVAAEPAPAVASSAAADAAASTLPPIGAYLRSIYPARALEKGLVKEDAERFEEFYIESSDDLFAEYREVEKENKNFILHLQEKYGISKLAFKIAQNLQARFDALSAKMGNKT